MRVRRAVYQEFAARHGISQTCLWYRYEHPRWTFGLSAARSCSCHSCTDVKTTWGGGEETDTLTSRWAFRLEWRWNAPAVDRYCASKLRIWWQVEWEFVYDLQVCELFDMNMSYRLAFCKTIAQLMSHNNRRQLLRRKWRQWYSLPIHARTTRYTTYHVIPIRHIHALWDFTTR